MGARQLDLCMELGKVIDVTACEQELHQRVVLYENRLNSEAQSEVELAVQRHEARLGSMAAAEVQQVRQRVRHLDFCNPGCRFSQISK